MTLKTPAHWESANDWKHGICNSCAHNSHEKVRMVKQTISVGNPGDGRTAEVWLCPACGYCREL